MSTFDVLLFTKRERKKKLKKTGQGKWIVSGPGRLSLCRNEFLNISSSPCLFVFLLSFYSFRGTLSNEVSFWAATAVRGWKSAKKNERKENCSLLPWWPLTVNKKKERRRHENSSSPQYIQLFYFFFFFFALQLLLFCSFCLVILIRCLSVTTTTKVNEKGSVDKWWIHSTTTDWATSRRHQLCKRTSIWARGHERRVGLTVYLLSTFMLTVFLFQFVLLVQVQEVKRRIR